MTEDSKKIKFKGKKKPTFKKANNTPKKNVVTTVREMEKANGNIILKTTHIDMLSHKEASKATYSVRFTGVEKPVEYANLFLAREGAKGEAPVPEKVEPSEEVASE